MKRLKIPASYYRLSTLIYYRNTGNWDIRFTEYGHEMMSRSNFVFSYYAKWSVWKYQPAIIDYWEIEKLDWFWLNENEEFGYIQYSQNAIYKSSIIKWKLFFSPMGTHF